MVPVVRRGNGLRPERSYRQSAVGPDDGKKRAGSLFGKGVSVKLSAVEMAEGKARRDRIGKIQKTQNASASAADREAAVGGKIKQLKNDAAPFPASELPQSVPQGIDGESVRALAE